jgi:hypothetical protein
VVLLIDAPSREPSASDRSSSLKTAEETLPVLCLLLGVFVGVLLDVLLAARFLPPPALMGTALFFFLDPTFKLAVGLPIDPSGPSFPLAALDPLVSTIMASGRVEGVMRARHQY